jgi:Xaa-Pro aminopeptidase
MPSAVALAQPRAVASDTARFAARRARAYERLGGDLLIAQSRSTPARATQAGFDQDPSFFYFTGAERVLGAVLVLDGATRRAEMFVPQSLREFVGAGARDQPIPGSAAAAALHVDGVSAWNELPSYIDRRLTSNPQLVIHVDDGGVEADFAGRLGTPLDSLAAVANQYVALGRALRRRWPNARIVPDTTISVVLRAVKDAGEIATLRRVGRASADAFFAGLSRFAAGRRQRDVEAAVVASCTRSGDGPSFWPWAMTGPNAAFPAPFSSFLDPHYLDREMRAGEVARFDLGCKVDHYMGDVGRTVPVSGRFSADQAEVIDLLAAVYRAGLATLRDGTTGRGVLEASMAEAARRRPAMRTALGRHAAALMTSHDSIPYWQWHGIGLDYAEPLPNVLRTGMVLDYEPILVVEGQGFYMEDMILVTRTGYEILTPGLPTSAAEIERAMRRSRVATPTSWNAGPREVPRYSLRSASVGSVMTARRAGIQLATSATRPRSATIETKVSGSVALTPYRSPAMARVAASAATTPIASPAPASAIPCPTTRRKTSAGRAPNAMRIPISRVRRFTACDMIP